MCASEMIEHRKNSWELYGFDFMVDADYNAWLIEINSSPACDYSTTVTERYVQKALVELLSVVLDTREWEAQPRKTRAAAPPDTGGWERIYQGPLLDMPVGAFGTEMSLKGEAYKTLPPRAGGGGGGGNIATTTNFSFPTGQQVETASAGAGAGGISKGRNGLSSPQRSAPLQPTAPLGAQSSKSTAARSGQYGSGGSSDAVKKNVATVAAAEEVESPTCNDDDDGDEELDRRVPLPLQQQQSNDDDFNDSDEDKPSRSSAVKGSAKLGVQQLSSTVGQKVVERLMVCP